MGDLVNIEGIKSRVMEVFRDFEERNKKVALITGVTGQDGSYLAEFLIKQGYLVYGLERRKALEDQSVKRKNEAIIIPCDITNYSSVFNAIQKVRPDDIYHLAAQSDVWHSFKDPFQTLDTNIMGTLNILEAMRILVPNSRLYFAGSSEMFGKVSENLQYENTKFHPRSPYGMSKCAGFHLCQNYREAYNLFICCGILFNHESPRRGKEFVTRKITSFAVRMKKGEDIVLELGNLDSKRDWGYAKDYVEAMWLMLQQKNPDDYVICTNENHSVREFVEEVFNLIGMPVSWEGEGVNEVGKYNGKILVRVNPEYYRPAEVDTLHGDYSKAKRNLGWEPRTSFKELVKKIVEGDLKDI
jgi:GDPmannose 4,6-dehydratase